MFSLYLIFLFLLTFCNKSVSKNMVLKNINSTKIQLASSPSKSNTQFNINNDYTHPKQVTNNTTPTLSIKIITERDNSLTDDLFDIKCEELTEHKKKNHIISPILDKFFNRLDLSYDSLDKNILETIEKELNKNNFSKFTTWYTMDSMLKKLFYYLLTNTTGYIYPNVKEHIALELYTKKKKIYPKNNSIPLYDLRMIKKLISLNSIFISTQTSFKLLWAFPFYVMLFDNIYNYYVYPHLRGNTTLWQILCNDTGESSSLIYLSSFICKKKVWIPMLSLGILNIILMTCISKRLHKKLLLPSEVDITISTLQNYKKNIFKDFLGNLCMCNRTTIGLRKAKKILILNANIDEKRRQDLIANITKIATKSQFGAQLNSIRTLCDIGYSVSFNDLKIVSELGMHKRHIFSLIKTKSLAINSLKKLSKCYVRDNSRCCYFSLNFKYIFTSIVSYFYLWKLGYLVPIFFIPIFIIIELKKIYDIFTFVMLIINIIKTF